MPPINSPDGLTKKQRGFIKEYIKPNTTGTSSAMKVYNCKNENVAKVIASENLTKPNVKSALQIELDRLNNLDLEITQKAIEAGISEIIDKTKADKPKIALDAYNSLAELKRYKQDRPDTTAYLVQIEQKDLSKCSQEELTNELLKRLSLPMDKASIALSKDKAI
jgi:hypothetical protein